MLHLLSSLNIPLIEKSLSLGTDVPGMARISWAILGSSVQNSPDISCSVNNNFKSVTLRITPEITRTSGDPSRPIWSPHWRQPRPSSSPQTQLPSSHREWGLSQVLISRNVSTREQFLAIYFYLNLKAGKINVGIVSIKRLQYNFSANMILNLANVVVWTWECLNLKVSWQSPI